MKAWRLFLHSWRQLFGNLPAALQVSAVPYLTGQALLFGSGLHQYTTPQALQAAIETNVIHPGMALLVGLISATMSLWVAVAWHRFVLTEERGGLLPAFAVDRVLGYFGKGLLIGLIVLVPAMLMLTLGAVLAAGLLGPDPSRASTGSLLLVQLVPMLVLLPVFVGMMRLSAMLPGAALRSGVPILAGWKATEGSSGDILGLVILTFGAGLVVQWPMAQLIDPVMIFLWSSVTGWFGLMLGASVLTTLYGHYIERRPLV